MTMPSPWHVRSFASVKLSLTRIAQRPSREGNVTAVEGAALAPGDGVVPAGLVVAGGAGAGEETARQGTTPARNNPTGAPRPRPPPNSHVGKLTRPPQGRVAPDPR